MRILLVFGLVLAVSACSGGSSSSLNPFTWFGGEEETQEVLAPKGGYRVAVDARPLIHQVTGLSVDRTSYGIILRATALTPSQGYFDADLVAVTDPGAGQLVFEYRARPPQALVSAGKQNQREIIAATFISSQKIRGIRQIRVVSATNSLTTRP